MMNLTIITSILLLLSSSVFAEASVNTQHHEKTFLMTAPGTVTGKSRETQSSAMQTIPQNLQSFGQRPMRYKYVGERTKFRQFGQEPAQNNPWFKEYDMGYPQHLPPSGAQAISNPWQLGGMPPLRGMMGAQADPYSSGPPPMYGQGQFSGTDKLYPDFPGGIYRDTNPAAFASPRRNNSFMPGFGGDNFGLPFTPFGMF